MSHRVRLLPGVSMLTAVFAIFSGEIGLFSAICQASAADSASENYYLGISAVSRAWNTVVPNTRRIGCAKLIAVYCVAGLASG